MSVLSNDIEKFIKSMFDSKTQEASLQRNELADYFGCAPTQINYVITTRFSPEKGYVTESRRGGGGYIRIVRIDVNKHDYVINILKTMPDEISYRQASKIAEGLKETGIINELTKKMILAGVSDSAIAVPAGIKDKLRAKILKQMLLALVS